MNTSSARLTQRVARERTLYRYHRALKRRDFATVAQVLVQAQQDTELAQMIREYNETLALEYQTSTRSAALTVMLSSPNASHATHGSSDTNKADPGSATHRGSSALSPSSGPGMHSSLHFPDLSAWHMEPQYSPQIARALRAAYRALHTTHDSARLANASLLVRPFLGQRMALPQRTAINYICALALIGDQEYRQAVDLIDDALEAALDLHAPGTVVDLLYLRGGCHRALGCLKVAAQDLNDCLQLLRTESDSGSPADVAFELAVITQLAGYKFFLADYEAANAYLDQTQPLIHLAREDKLNAANILWNHALLDRLRGHPEVALRSAMEAAHVYETCGSTLSAARIQTLTADIALDIAQASPSEVDRSAFVVLAQSHAELGLHLAREAGDPSGMTLARFAEIRLSRITQENRNRVSEIERTLRVAQRTKDLALLTQGYSALGDEFASSGEGEQSLRCYREALAVLEGSDMLALRTWPQRALLKAAEMVS